MHIKTFFQYIVPQHGLSRLVGLLARARIPWLKNFLIKIFISFYKIDVSEAAEPDIKKYPDFNSFFTRALRADARPIALDEHYLISPVDGCVSQVGQLDGISLLQAKGHHFTLEQLFAGRLPEYVSALQNGSFATLYLSPRDYHRVHMPISGRLLHMVYVPGKLFSVNQHSSENIGNIYARNERVIAIFTTDLGPVAVVMVGAMLVGSIVTSWEEGVVTPASGRSVHIWDYNDDIIELKKGVELGRFQFGSTVILVLPPGKVEWNDYLQLGSEVVMGAAIGNVVKKC